MRRLPAVLLFAAALVAPQSTEAQSILQDQSNGSWFTHPTFSIGQTFTALNTRLDAFSLWMGSGIGSYQAHLYLWNGIAQTGSSLWSSGVQSTTGSTHVQTTFNPGVGIATGAEYIFFVTQSATPQISVLDQGSGNLYAGGRAVRAQFSAGTSPDLTFTAANIAASSFGNAPGDDLRFSAAFSENVVSVPEPGTLLLMLTSMLGMGFVAWRRKEEVEA